jgi:putative restriction endonuclease
MARSAWNRNELILALYLYHKIPFSKIHYKNPAIIELAQILKRTPSAVTLKMVNFARLDPLLRNRNISGMTHGSKADELLWYEFAGNIEKLFNESQNILKSFTFSKPGGINNIKSSFNIELESGSFYGEERNVTSKARIKQAFFRDIILAAYDNKCCITGLSIVELLVASHIVPWAVDKKNRMNPCNGLCLNALHDKAFDKGFITLTPNFEVKVSEKLKKCHSESNDFLIHFDRMKISLPQRFLPAVEFIEYHNKFIFIG